MKRLGNFRRDARRRVPALLFSLIAVAALAQPASAEMRPLVNITGPIEGHVYAPGEALQVLGTASANLTVAAVKLEYWLANKIVRRVLAECRDCGSFATGWKDTPTDLMPGYYVVKAYSYDQAGTQSDPQQRAFVEGANRIPKPPTITPPTPPSTPTAPAVPTITDPVPGTTLPGATAPTTISGRATPGDKVTGTDPTAGQLFAVQTEDDGTWTAIVRLPDGEYRLRTQATNSTGRRSKVSKDVRFTVDAQRPTLRILTQNLATFLPTTPVHIEGAIFDNRRVATVRLDYYLLNKLATRSLVQCVGCSALEGTWSDNPDLPYPGYYEVKIVAFDAAGNPSYVGTTTFLTTA